MVDYVTTEQCKEFRDTCGQNRRDERDSRDGWIGKVEAKVDKLIWLALTQIIVLAVALVILLVTDLHGGTG